MGKALLSLFILVMGCKGEPPPPDNTAFDRIAEEIRASSNPDSLVSKWIRLDKWKVGDTCGYGMDLKYVVVKTGRYAVMVRSLNFGTLRTWRAEEVYRWHGYFYNKNLNDREDDSAAIRRFEQLKR